MSPARARFTDRLTVGLMVVAGSCGCSDEQDRPRLEGSIDIELGMQSFKAAGKPSKHRAQITDSRKSCDFWARSKWSDHRLRVDLKRQEAAPLVAGQSASVIAADHIIGGVLTSPTVELKLANGELWYSTAGSVSVDPLPAPVERLEISFGDVTMRNFATGDQATLRGGLEATYLGAVVLSGEEPRACPNVAEYPGGVTL